MRVLISQASLKPLGRLVPLRRLGIWDVLGCHHFLELCLPTRWPFSKSAPNTVWSFHFVFNRKLFIQRKCL